MCLVILALACTKEEPPPPPALPPAPKTAPLTPAADLAEALPRIQRDTPFDWKNKSLRVPGHFAAYLVVSDPDRRVIVLTIDDLRDRPDRLTFYRSMPTHVGKYKGRTVSPDFIQVLVADRYEVAVRALHEEFRNTGKLGHWFDRIRFGALEKAAAQHAPDAAPGALSPP